MGEAKQATLGLGPSSAGPEQHSSLAPFLLNGPNL